MSKGSEADSLCDGMQQVVVGLSAGHTCSRGRDETSHMEGGRDGYKRSFNARPISACIEGRLTQDMGSIGRLVGSDLTGKFVFTRSGQDLPTTRERLYQTAMWWRVLHLLKALHSAKLNTSLMKAVPSSIPPPSHQYTTRGVCPTVSLSQHGFHIQH